MHLGTKDKDAGEASAKAAYVFQARAVDFAQNFDFGYARNAIARLEYIDEEKDVVAAFKIALELIKIAFASVAIAKNSTSTKNN